MIISPSRTMINIEELVGHCPNHVPFHRSADALHTKHKVMIKIEVIIITKNIDEVYLGLYPTHLLIGNEIEV